MSRTVSVLLVLVTMTACGSLASRGPASSARESSSVPSAASSLPANTGQITGNLSYPAGVLPAQTVYAVAPDRSSFFTVETVFGQRTYTMLGVAPGDYFVLSLAPGRLPYDQVIASLRPAPGQDPFPAGYTKAVPCGGSAACTDHTLIAVHVAAGTTTTGVDPVDWCWPECSMPVIPPSGTPPVRTGVPVPDGQPPSPFQDPKQAAAYLLAADMTGRSVASGDDCPINVACVWTTGEHGGQSAAYFTAQAGSNGSNQNCAVYLVDTASGWQAQGYGYGNFDCLLNGTPFPSVGGSGEIVMGPGETGCVNVHSKPGLSAKVVGCLAVATAVTIDDGPVFVATTSQRQIDYSEATDYWWHVSGRGWVVHAYLLPRHYG